MTKKGFSLPMSKLEKIFGWIYAIAHIFLMPYGTALLISICERIGIEIGDKYVNLTYYGIGFLLIFIFMHHYMKEMFYDLCENKMNTVIAVTNGYLFYYVLSYVISAVIYAIAGETINPNNDAVIKEYLANKNIMLAVAAIIAPIVEEFLFRGVIFGTIRKSSRLTAYIVSVLMFAIYHLWQYFIYDFSPDLFIDLLNYVPGGIVLAWTYERGRNLWASVILHMLINFVALSISVTFLG